MDEFLLWNGEWKENAKQLLQTLEITSHIGETKMFAYISIKALGHWEAQSYELC